MITKLKKVYYCEFCGKKGMHPYWMKEHEKTCNLNPNRSCKLCDITPSLFGGLIEKYSDAYEVVYPGGKKESVSEFKENDTYAFPALFDASVIWKKEIIIDKIAADCENCPVCVLALLKITGLINMPGMDYKYDEEFKAWQVSKECEQPGYYGYT
jgi:hypothetical protein